MHSFFLQAQKHFILVTFFFVTACNEPVKKDWDLCKDRWNKVILFDDYHLPTKQLDSNIEVTKVVDQIEDFSKELIIMDRRIFFDDRKMKDEEIDYGQVILTK